VKEHRIVNLLCKHYFMIGVELRYLIGSGYLRIFDGVCQAIKKLEAVGCQPIEILLRGTYHKSTNENASSRQIMCIYIRQLRVSKTLTHSQPSLLISRNTITIYHPIVTLPTSSTLNKSNETFKTGHGNVPKLTEEKDPSLKEKICRVLIAKKPYNIVTAVKLILSGNGVTLHTLQEDWHN